MKKVIILLYKALTHAELRLNEIPHRYQETDFRVIREALRAAEKIKGVK